MKSLYKGEFNWYGETLTYYCHAYTEVDAFRLFCHRLAKRIGVLPRKVRNYFNGEKDNFRITKEMKEGKEDKEDG